MQVCWIPIFKAQKLILAGDPMQLSPTIISVDKKTVKSGATFKPIQSSAKTASKKAVTKSDKAERANGSVRGVVDDADSSDDESGSSDDEDDPGMNSGAEKPLGSTKRPQGAKSKSVLRPPRSLETTLFERVEKMYGPGIKRMLTVQYR